MPQRAIATDGVEWIAADMSFDQNGRDADFLNRTLLLMGQAGVAKGGAVTDAGTRHINISGPLYFTVNGELDLIQTPATVLLGASDTWYVIAAHVMTDDTPATYYGSGTPPFKHHNPTPAIIVRNAGGGGPAVTNNGEVNLATVTTNATVVTLITDTRVIVPTVTAGNISLGSGNTIDTMDPSAHLADLGTPTHAAHVILGGPGGAARYALECPYYVVDLYGHDFGSSSYITNESDFTSPPGGAFVSTFRDPTKYGTFWREGFSGRWALRATLNFTSTAAFTATGAVQANNDTMRVKFNGVDQFTNAGTNYAINTTINLSVVIGANVLKLYFYNFSSSSADDYSFQFLSDLLNDSRITFTPM